MSDLAAQPSAPALPAVASAERDQPTGIASVIDAPACAQLFLMSRDLFTATRLGDRNVILVHDATGDSYDGFVTDEQGARARLFEWVAHWLADRPRIQDVYCLGFSAGGPLAMLAGHSLRARTVWAFAPRPARRNVVKDTQEDLARTVERVTGKTPRALQGGMMAADVRAIDAHITPEFVRAYHQRLCDPRELVDTEYLRTLADALSRGNGVTEYRLYYVPDDVCDAHVVDALKHCPGVVPMPIAPSETEPPPWPFSRWLPPVHWICRNHLVHDLLRERGQLAALFPAFRSAASPPSLL